MHRNRAATRNAPPPYRGLSGSRSADLADYVVDIATLDADVGEQPIVETGKLVARDRPITSIGEAFENVHCLASWMISPAAIGGVDDQLT